MTAPLVSAKALAKRYGAKQALYPTDLEIPPGRVVGVIGANGAGKSTLLNCLLGLMPYDGELSVCGHDPLMARDRMMEDVCFIADVATLPRWAKVGELLDWVEGMHPKFDRKAALARLAQTNVTLSHRVKQLSKGMTVQAHLAIALSINARLLVLDEPTLGLDIINRRKFYDAVISDFFDENRTIIITTHQVEEIEQILTHTVFIKDGRVTLDAAMEDIGERFRAVDVPDDQLAALAELKPIYSRRMLGKTTAVIDGGPAEALAQFGASRRVSLSDLFVALAEPGVAAEAVA
jgi:ABC-2 type transport system ATP-binding protein